MIARDLTPYLTAAESRLGRWIGIDLGRGGIARAVRRHVAHRVHSLGEPDVPRFCALLDEPGSTEARALVEAATVPHSWLFRDAVQLDAVSQVLSARRRGPVSIWVAGCASGEDAVTFAALATSLGHAPSVLATDVNETALERARRGRYDAFRTRDVGPSMRRFFRDEGRDLVVTPELARTITFRRHSLLEPYPDARDGEGFDLIVCRNVLIYFGRDDAHRVVSRLAERLAPSGLLVLGVSDVLQTLPESLVPSTHAGRLVLVRAADRPRAAPKAERVLPRFERTEPLSVRPPPARGPSALDVQPTLDALDAGDTERALSLLHALGDVRADAELSLLEGLARFARTEHSAAATSFDRASALAPGCWVAWLHLGLARERLGDFARARSAFVRVAEARGHGESLPRGRGELTSMLHGSRASFTRLALERARSIERGGKP